MDAKDVVIRLYKCQHCSCCSSIFRHWLGDFSTAAPPGLVRFYATLVATWPPAMPSGPDMAEFQTKTLTACLQWMWSFLHLKLGVRFWKKYGCEKRIEKVEVKICKNRILANELLSCYFWLLVHFLRKAQLNCYLRHLDLQRSPLPSTAKAKRNSVCSSKRDLGGRKQLWTVKGRIPSGKLT